MPGLRTKTAILSIRITPVVRRSLEEAAKAERRSLANMTEVLILEGCGRRGVPARAARVSSTSIKKKTR